MTRSLRDDLLASDKIRQKCNNDAYSQELYAAMCNVEWQPTEVFEILKGHRCLVSWRTAGKIVAEIRGRGDYMDWFCSSILSKINEGEVTDEIRNDLKELGWVPVPN